MAEPLDDRYLDWLYSLVATEKIRNGSRTHWQLLHELNNVPFVWFVPNDDNRAEDGRDLRVEFLDIVGEDSPKTWMDLECSILEMLIGLSRRAAFESLESPGDWFWRFIENLGLLDYIDRSYGPYIKRSIKSKVFKLNNREYSYSGQGGLFPLREAATDQRNVEIWYQMCAYLLENEPEIIND